MARRRSQVPRPCVAAGQREQEPRRGTGDGQPLQLGVGRHERAHRVSMATGILSCLRFTYVLESWCPSHDINMSWRAEQVLPHEGAPGALPRLAAALGPALRGPGQAAHQVIANVAGDSQCCGASHTVPLSLSLSLARCRSRSLSAATAGAGGCDSQLCGDSQFCGWAW
jgi:hypothetical protein